MSLDIPEERRYLASHEWVLKEDGEVRIGISDFAQDELGDVVFVELPPVGDAIERAEPFGVVESIKAVSDLYAPIGGEVIDVNEELYDRPELVNDDPYGDGWMIVVAPDDPSEIEDLLDANSYREQIE